MHSKVRLSSLLQKMSFRADIVTLCLVSLFFVLFHASQTSKVIKQEGEFLTSLVFANLYSYMREGWNKDDINQLLDNINQQYTHAQFHLHRSVAVEEQFGKRREDAHLTEKEIALLSNQTERSVFGFDSSGNLSYARRIIFEQECIGCHVQAVEGQTAGILTVEYPFTSLRVGLLGSLLTILMAMLMTLLVSYLLYQSQIKKQIVLPLTALTHRLKQLTSFSEFTIDVPTQSNIEEIRYIEQVLEEEHNNLHRANVELERLSTTDSLTGIYNRSMLDRCLEQEAQRYKRYGAVFSLISIDLNCFKPINDEYGHQVGDKALKHFAYLLKQNCRVNDYPIRVGGDEFIVILANSSAEEAEGFVAKFNQLLANYPVNFEGGNFFLEASFGVADCSAQNRQAVDIDTLLHSADVAMYENKRLSKEASSYCYDN